MSVTKRPQTECNGCHDQFRTGYNGAYCSRQCYFEAKGQRALNKIAHDHKLCASCGALLKTVDEPTEGWKNERGGYQNTVINHGGSLTNVDDLGIVLDATDASQRKPTSVDSVIGHEHHTPNTTEGVDGEETNTGEVTYTRVSCTCGNVDPSEEIDELREIHAARTLANVYKRLVELHSNGAIDKRIDKESYFEAYKESSSLAYAVGVGLHGQN
jgi:hypothetical protein